MMIGRLLLALAALFAGSPTLAGERDGSAYDFIFTSIEGTPLPLSRFEGKIVLVINTASRCGFTRQYAGLQAVWERYRDRGLIVLGVPSNDFGGQELSTEAEIKDFCEVRFRVDFPLTAKARVKGDEAHPFFVWAADTFGPLAKPRWNFHKYLIGPRGELANWFATPDVTDLDQGGHLEVPLVLGFESGVWRGVMPICGLLR